MAGFVGILQLCGVWPSVVQSNVPTHRVNVYLLGALQNREMQGARRIAVAMGPRQQKKVTGDRET